MYSLQYSTTRREIWQWYWRAWCRPAGLWRFHLFIGLSAGAAAAISHGTDQIDWPFVAEVAAIAVVGCLIAFPIWPQLKHKPQIRTLQMDEHGFKTEIGKLRGERKWSEIRSIDDRDGTVVITSRNGNAMLIPERAFVVGMDRRRIVSDITKWQSQAVT